MGVFEVLQEIKTQHGWLEYRPSTANGRTGRLTIILIFLVKAQAGDVDNVVVFESKTL